MDPEAQDRRRAVNENTEKAAMLRDAIWKLMKFPKNPFHPIPFDQSDFRLPVQLRCQRRIRVPYSRNIALYLCPSKKYGGIDVSAGIGPAKPSCCSVTPSSGIFRFIWKANRTSGFHRKKRLNLQPL